MKLNTNQVKGISKLLKRESFEMSEYCEKCLQETDIENLNLATGVCCNCRSNVKRLDKETIEKLLRLSDA